MCAAIIGGNDVYRAGRVELVDLEPALDDWHVPPEQVDEKTFPIGEHRLQKAAVHRLSMFFNDVDHGVLPFG